MFYAQTVLPETICTPRLVLRRHGPDHVDDMVEYWSDPDFSAFRSAPAGRTREDAEHWIQRSRHLDWGSEPHWAIELDGKLIGGLSLRFEAEHGRADIAWEIARVYRNRGLATEAARALIDVAFETLPDLNKITAKANPRNVTSVRVMEKLGMRHEGTLREHIRVGDAYTDDVVYGLLQSEWAACVRAPGLKGQIRPG